MATNQVGPKNVTHSDLKCSVGCFSFALSQASVILTKFTKICPGLFLTMQL